MFHNIPVRLLGLALHGLGLLGLGMTEIDKGLWASDADIAGFQDLYEY